MDRETQIPADAMNVVLQAEQRALDVVKDCECEAAGIIDAARQQARTIAERTNRRISHVHADSVRATSQQIEAMLKEDAAATNHAVDPKTEKNILEMAVKGVAARLTEK
jgi:vacuolar-type H+-ATPase subunit H